MPVPEKFIMQTVFRFMPYLHIILFSITNLYAFVLLIKPFEWKGFWAYCMCYRSI